MKKCFTLAELMVVMVIIALLSAVAIPNLIRAREKAEKETNFYNNYLKTDLITGE